PDTLPRPPTSSLFPYTTLFRSIALQDNLGTLQDGVVAREYVDALGLTEDQGAQTYLAARDAERAPLLAELPRLWEKVASATYRRSEEHTSELQSRFDLVCRLLL